MAARVARLAPPALAPVGPDEVEPMKADELWLADLPSAHDLLHSAHALLEAPILGDDPGPGHGETPVGIEEPESIRNARSTRLLADDVLSGAQRRGDGAGHCGGGE